MDCDELVTRREITMGALVAAFFPGALRAGPDHAHGETSDAPPDPNLLRDYKPRFFTEEEYAALQAFTEILIPSDDTPGAREAHCALFIDFVLDASGEAPQTQKNWRGAMQAVKATGFFDADAARRLELVREMSRPERDANAKHDAYAAYRLIKQQTVFAFYTSRAGMIETLDYKGNSYNVTFPACTHPEHRTV